MCQRRVCLDDDMTLLQPRRDVRVIESGVQLVLSDIDLADATALDVLLQFFEVVDSVVRYTDRLGFTSFLCLDQRAP